MAGVDPEQLVREAYEAWNATGPEALMPFTAEGVELDDARELPDAATWRGRDAVRGRLEDVAKAVGSGSGVLESFRRAGAQVFVRMSWRREGDAPDEASLGTVFHVVHVIEGKIARISVFLDEGTALRAAGIYE